MKKKKLKKLKKIKKSIESNLLNITSDSNNLKNPVESANDSSNTIIDSTHRNQRHVEAQSEWIDVSQDEWNNFQETIQSMNATNQTLQVTLKVIQTSILTNQHTVYQFAIFVQQSILIQQISNHDFRWNVVDRSFFDSLYDGKSAFIENIIEHFEKNIYFRNVHIFVKRIKDMI